MDKIIAEIAAAHRVMLSGTGDPVEEVARHLGKGPPYRRILLVRSAAILISEIERLDRAAAAATGGRS